MKKKSVHLVGYSYVQFFILCLFCNGALWSRIGLPEAFFLGSATLKTAAVAVVEWLETRNEQQGFFLSESQSTDTHPSGNLKLHSILLSWAK
jgi:hypothetical protein